MNINFANNPGLAPNIYQVADYVIYVWEFPDNDDRAFPVAPALVYHGYRSKFDFDSIKPNQIAVDAQGHKVLR